MDTRHLTHLRVGGVEVVIESPFTLRAGGREYALDPRERGALGPLLALYPDTLNAASTGSDGTLHLTLASGATITVPPNPLYEPWQIVGPGSAMIVVHAGNRRPVGDLDMTTAGSTKRTRGAGSRALSRRAGLTKR
jgi:Family of unknown function (DUF6188)